jgi:hypothetical protein
MRIYKYWWATASVLLLAPLLAFAQANSEILKTDWLELEKGYRGETVGAELVEIEEGDTADMQEITVAIPKTAISHPDTIEEVVVIGKKPEKPEPLDITYEWVDDYDKDNYGLVIRLGKNTNWPIRLYMNSTPGFVR